MGRRKSTKKSKKNKNPVDKVLLGLTLGLVVFGLVAIADASAPQAQATFGDSFHFVKQQALWGVLGLVGLFFASNINYNFWKKMATPLLFVSILFLILVLIPQFGGEIYGAKRWLRLGPIGFQPAEVVKLSVALYFASLAASEKELMSYLIPVAVIVFLIMLQPDFGTTLVVIAICVAQLFIIGLDFISFVILGGAGLLGSVAMVLLSDYRRQRLLTFFEKNSDPLGSGYHIRQILIALGSGGFFGVGLGQSRQKYLFLPEVATDSVFAVIAEEVGFIGGTILIFVMTFFIYKLIDVALHAPDEFSKVFSVGIIGWVASQFFLNIGSMVAIVPLTGIPLPFFSYGGTSLTMTLFSIGIILNVSRFRVKSSYKKR